MGFKGFTLPVWVAAAARAATEVLVGQPFEAEQKLVLPNQKGLLCVPVTSGSLLLDRTQAIGISHCNSDLSLDLTSGLEIWACVQWQEQLLDEEQEVANPSTSWLNLVAGFGVGKFESSGDPCISEFARDLLHQNLRPLVPLGRSLRLEVIFPKGAQLAERTSNKAFGVVDGLSLIGMQADAQESASPDQLQKTIEQLRRKCTHLNCERAITLVIGENGLDLALKLGLSSDSVVKAGNWVGPLLVAAAEAGVKELLVFGYHGKLIKLAGGIFHTHHHLADGRLETLTALAVQQELPLNLIRDIGQADSIEAALLMIEDADPHLAQKLWMSIAMTVEMRCAAYLARYGSWTIDLGAALFDRQRRVRWAGPVGQEQLVLAGVNLEG